MPLPGVFLPWGLWPQAFYSISASVATRDAKLEAFLAGATRTSTSSSRRYSEPCVGKVGATEERPLSSPAYSRHPAFMAEGAVRRQLDDPRNLLWLGVMISREDAFVTLQKLETLISCFQTW